MKTTRRRLHDSSTIKNRKKQNKIFFANKTDKRECCIVYQWENKETKTEGKKEATCLNALPANNKKIQRRESSPTTWSCIPITLPFCCVWSNNKHKKEKEFDHPSIHKIVVTIGFSFRFVFYLVRCRHEGHSWKLCGRRNPGFACNFERKPRWSFKKENKK
jgi:hypothetical protein